MRNSPLRLVIIAIVFGIIVGSTRRVEGKLYTAYISDGPDTSIAYWLAKEVGLSYKDIQAVTVGGAPARNAAVITGRVDFTVATDSGKIEGEKAGLKVIIDMAKLKIPFQFSCTVTTGRMVRQSPDVVRSMVKAMAEAVHYYKTQKEDAIRIMQKYTRGQNRVALEGTYAAYKELLVEDAYPTLEGLKNTLEIQASFDPKAAKTKVEDFVDVRFVDELRKTGFIDQLYNRERVIK